VRAFSLSLSLSLSFAALYADKNAADVAIGVVSPELTFMDPPLIRVDHPVRHGYRKALARLARGFYELSFFAVSLAQREARQIIERALFAAAIIRQLLRMCM